MAAYSDLQANVDYALALSLRKLGPGARIERMASGEWIAERQWPSARSRVTGKDLPTLTWFLEQMPDPSGGPT